MTNPDDGKFVVVVQCPFTGLYNKSSEIPAKATESEVKNSLKAYYNQYFGSSITVTKVMYDSSEAITTDEAASKKNVYTLALDKLINGQSVNGVMIAKTSTGSQIDFKLPEDVQLSKPPLGGKLMIKCLTENNQFLHTKEINIRTWMDWEVENRINNDCYQMNEKV